MSLEEPIVVLGYTTKDGSYHSFDGRVIIVGDSLRFEIAHGLTYDVFMILPRQDVASLRLHTVSDKAYEVRTGLLLLAAVAGVIFIIAFVRAQAYI